MSWRAATLRRRAPAARGRLPAAAVIGSLDPQGSTAPGSYDDLNGGNCGNGLTPVAVSVTANKENDPLTDEIGFLEPYPQRNTRRTKWRGSPPSRFPRSLQGSAKRPWRRLTQLERAGPRPRMNAQPPGQRSRGRRSRAALLPGVRSRDKRRRHTRDRRGP